MKLGYTIKIGNRSYRCLKGHYFNYDEDRAELTCMDETVYIVPINDKVIVLGKEWLQYRKEKLNEQVGSKIV